MTKLFWSDQTFKYLPQRFLFNSLEAKLLFSEIFLFIILGEKIDGIDIVTGSFYGLRVKPITKVEVGIWVRSHNEVVILIGPSPSKGSSLHCSLKCQPECINALEWDWVQIGILILDVVHKGHRRNDIIHAVIELKISESQIVANVECACHVFALTHSDRVGPSACDRNRVEVKGSDGNFEISYEHSKEVDL